MTAGGGYLLIRFKFLLANRKFRILTNMGGVCNYDYSRVICIIKTQYEKNYCLL